MSLTRFAIRLKFTLTSRASADQLIRDELAKTLAVADELGPEGCGTSVKCPKLLGVDDDMREWSFYQILEHNVIVNRRLAESIAYLTGNGPKPDPNFSIKHDTLPSSDPGLEQMAAFEKSVTDYLEQIATVPQLRGTETVLHPLFGPIDAHKSHCLFGFHLQLHRKQAESLVPLIKKTG